MNVASAYLRLVNSKARIAELLSKLVLIASLLWLLLLVLVKDVIRSNLLSQIHILLLVINVPSLFLVVSLVFPFIDQWLI